MSLGKSAEKFCLEEKKLRGIAEEFRKERERVDRKREELEERKIELQRRVKLLEKIRSDFNLKKNATLSLLTSLKNCLQDDDNDVKASLLKLKRERLLQMAKVFQIEPPHQLDGLGAGTICGLTFPSSLSLVMQMTTIERRSVLVQLSRLVLLISKYFEISLNADVVCEQDDVLINGESLILQPSLQNLKLFCSVVKNLCMSLGLSSDQLVETEMLHNLWELLHFPKIYC